MRVVLIVVGAFVLVGRKLVAVLALLALCLFGAGWVLHAVGAPYMRRARLNAKVLWLAFQVWRHNRLMRAFKVNVETYAAAHQGEMSDLLLKRLKWVQGQNARLNAKAKELQQRASSGL